MQERRSEARRGIDRPVRIRIERPIRIRVEREGEPGPFVPGLLVNVGPNGAYVLSASLGATSGDEVEMLIEAPRQAAELGPPLEVSYRGQVVRVDEKGGVGIRLHPGLTHTDAIG